MLRQLVALWAPPKLVKPLPPPFFYDMTKWHCVSCRFPLLIMFKCSKITAHNNYIHVWRASYATIKFVQDVGFTCSFTIETLWLDLHCIVQLAQPASRFNEAAHCSFYLWMFLSSVLYLPFGALESDLYGIIHVPIVSVSFDTANSTSPTLCFLFYIAFKSTDCEGRHSISSNSRVGVWDTSTYTGGQYNYSGKYPYAGSRRTQERATSQKGEFRWHTQVLACGSSYCWACSTCTL